MARADMRTVGCEAVQPVQPLSLCLISGILLILFSLMGCSDSSNLGPFLTVDDVDRYIFSTEDSICVQSDADPTCVIYVLVEGEGANNPVINIHPTKLIYVIYREGVITLRPARATGVGGGGNGGGGAGGVGGGDGGGGGGDGGTPGTVGVDTPGTVGGGGGTVFLDNDPINNDPINNDPINNDPINNDPINNNPINNNPINNNPINNNPINNDQNNNDQNNNDPINNDQNNNDQNNNGGGSNGCEGNWVVDVIWYEKDGQRWLQSGVICGDYVHIEGNEENENEENENEENEKKEKTITFTGADGMVDEGDSKSDYVRVVEDLTWEEAKKLAPEILIEEHEKHLEASEENNN